MMERNKIAILRATEADIEDLVRVINLAYGIESKWVMEQRTSVCEVSTLMSSDGGLYLYVPGDLAGVTGLQGAVFVRANGSEGYLGPLAVDPSRQQRGLGRRLVLAAEEHCIMRGCHRMVLDVLSCRPELVRYYEAAGFAVIGTAPYPKPERLRCSANLLIMSKPLRAGAVAE